MTDGVGSENYTYNNLGQTTELDKTIGSTNYPVKYQYNLAGELTQITYPSNRVVQQSVDAVGRLCEIAPSTTGCGTASSPFATGYGYNTASQLTGFNYGNGVATTIGYSSDGRLKIASLKYAKGSTTLLNLNYWYKQDSTNCTTGTAGNNGQIQCITDSVDNGRTIAYTYDTLARISTAATTGSTNYPAWGLQWTYDRYGNPTAETQTCNYVHDDLTRLASANCGSAAAQTFSYDPFGNISKSGSPYAFQPTYNSATNRFATLPGTTPSYDANGNVLSDGSHSYAWDAEGNSVTVDTVGLTFDALDRMVEQARGTSYTQIVYAPTGGKLALMNGQSLVKAFVPLPGQATAVYTSSGLDHYRHSDWLGSARLTSSPSRAYISSVAYAPFGETYASYGTSDPSFTGQNPDTVSTAYDFLYRPYSIQGRWPSPDPSGVASVDPSNPQSWNRYAYVLNNPLTNIDPNGLDCILFTNDDETEALIFLGDCGAGQEEGYFVDGTVTGEFYNSDGQLIGVSVNGGNGMQPVGTAPGDSFTVRAYTPDPFAAAEIALASVPRPSKADCLNAFYTSTPGKIVEAASPLSAIPGFNPHWKKNALEWLGAGLVKKPLLSGAAQGKDYPSIITGSANTETTLLNRAARKVEQGGKKAAPWLLIYASMIDVQAHITCIQQARGTDVLDVD